VILVFEGRPNYYKVFAAIVNAAGSIAVQKFFLYNLEI